MKYGVMSVCAVMVNAETTMMMCDVSVMMVMKMKMVVWILVMMVVVGDMFGEDLDEDVLYLNSTDVGGDAKRAKRAGGAVDMFKGLVDNWDDVEGYYCVCIGEVLDGWYMIMVYFGKGVFLNVLRAVDELKTEGESSEVAIKVIRCNDFMYKVV